MPSPPAALHLTLTALALLALTPDAHAQELRYRWVKGQTQRFEATGTDTLALNGMGMAIEARYATRARFALAIDRVDPTGRARGQVILEAFEVKDDQGRVVAGLESIPRGALRSPLEIDAKGRFKLKELVALVIDDDGERLLVTHEVSPTGGSAQAQLGDEKVTVFAGFDPKTGKLSGGAKIEKVAQAKKRRTVQVERDAQTVELLPRQLLELLVLPEGQLRPGATFEVAAGPTQIKVAVEALTDQRATLRTQILTPEAESKPGAAEAPSETPDLSGMMGGLMPGAQGGAGGGGPAGVSLGAGAMGGLTLDGAFTSQFDRAAGMLAGLEGQLTTALKQAGVQVSTTSRIELKPVR